MLILQKSLLDCLTRKMEYLWCVYYSMRSLKCIETVNANTDIKIRKKLFQQIWEKSIC